MFNLLITTDIEPAEQIRTRRKSIGWSQERLARAAGVSRSTLSRYESGARAPSLAAYKKILAVMNVDLCTVSEEE